ARAVGARRQPKPRLPRAPGQRLAHAVGLAVEQRPARAAAEPAGGAGGLTVDGSGLHGRHSMQPIAAPVPVPALSDNYVWLLPCLGGDAVVVDPGEAAPVRAALARHALRPAAVLLTHHHADHIGGTAVLLRDFPWLP